MFQTYEIKVGEGGRGYHGVIRQSSCWSDGLIYSLLVKDCVLNWYYHSVQVILLRTQDPYEMMKSRYACIVL